MQPELVELEEEFEIFEIIEETEEGDSLFAIGKIPLNKYNYLDGMIKKREEKTIIKRLISIFRPKR